MKIKKAMILAAGLGTRLKPITDKIPKPLIKVNNKCLLERSIILLKNHGVDEIVINVHHLSDQIKTYIRNNSFSVKITISDEDNQILDTGGGILKGTKKFKKEPFIVINPDTVWNKDYSKELEILEKKYFRDNVCILLLAHKKLSYDETFKGDFSLNIENIVSRETTNNYIYTGMQILNNGVFENVKVKKFSINLIWDELISLKKLKGHISNNRFIHINTKKIFDKINELKFID